MSASKAEHEAEARRRFARSGFQNKALRLQLRYNTSGQHRRMSIAMAAMWKHAHRMLMRDTPVIPLYYYVSRHLVKPGVDGFIDNVRDIHLSRYLDIETQSE